MHAPELIHVCAVLPGAAHRLAHGDHQAVASKVAELCRALAADGASGTTFDGAWAWFDAPERAVEAVLAAASHGAGVAVAIGPAVPLSGGPPIGLAPIQVSRLAALARAGESLMSRATLAQLASCLPPGIGHYDAPPGLVADVADVVLLADYR